MVVPKWSLIFNYISPIAVIGFIFYLGVSKQDINSRLFDSVNQKEQVLHITKDKSIHMPYKEKVLLFVPRTEIEYKFDIFMKNQEKIMKKLNVN